MTTALETLQKARKLVSNKRRWTQGAYGRDKYGESVFPSLGAGVPKSAVCFCSIGALAKVSNLRVQEAENSVAYEILQSIVGENAVCDFNDSSSHDDVLSAFDRAIEKARETTQ